MADFERSLRAQNEKIWDRASRCKSFSINSQTSTSSSNDLLFSGSSPEQLVAGLSTRTGRDGEKSIFMGNRSGASISRNLGAVHNQLSI